MDNRSLNELIEKYKLTKEEHNRVLELLREKLFTDKEVEENPSIMFVVGQPGCGKTTFIKSASLSKYIIISSDEYRIYSKYSKEILDKYPTDYAMQKGYSVLREKAPTDYSLLELIKLKPNDYDVVINVVVAGNLSSLLATRERYEKEILKSANAKLSNIEAHNKCYVLLPDFISGCLSLGARVNYITFVDNQVKSIHVGDDYLNLLQKLREESNEQVCLSYDVRMNNIKRNMINRNASKEQFDELNKIESIYSELY